MTLSRKRARTLLDNWKLRRLVVLTVIWLLDALLRPRPVTAQAAQSTVKSWVHVDSVSGSHPALRTAVQRVLVEQGIGVRSVAACDCLIEGERVTLPSGEIIQLFVHIIKAPTVIRGRVSLEAVIVPGSNAPAVARARADSLLRRVGRSINSPSSRLPSP